MMVAALGWFMLCGIASFFTVGALFWIGVCLYFKNVEPLMIAVIFAVLAVVFWYGVDANFPFEAIKLKVVS